LNLVKSVLLFLPSARNLPIAASEHQHAMALRPRSGFVALSAVVTITGATIFFVHRQQTQERQVILPRVFALSLVHSKVRFMRTDDAPSRAA